MKPPSRRVAGAPLSVGIYGEPELIVCGVTSMFARQGPPATVRGVEGQAAGEVDVVICDPVGRSVPIERYLAQVSALTDAPVLVFTWSSSPSSVRRSLDAGARAFVSKMASASELTRAVQAVHRGEQVVPQPAQVLPRGVPVLSQREMDVLDLICRGLSNLEIAEQLFVSVNSVKTYVRQVYQKIEVTRRSQAVAWGLAHGF